MDNYEKGVAEEEEGGEGTAVERAFEWQRVPPLREQLTARALAVSFLLSVMFSVIVMKLNLTTGIIPSLNVAAGLLGFFFVKLWTRALEHAGLRTPFTRQENTVIQASVTAAYGLAFSGGFGNYLFGMSSMIAKQATEANDSQNTKDPNLGWMIGFLFVVSFLGLFSLVPLRKIMIIDYKLIYPSGTATAYLINSFHTTQGEKLAGEQVGTLCKSFAGSFLWGFFQWFYTAGKDCGFIAFPTFGLKAYENKFYFDFSATYVGVGMICPHIVNLSLLLGAILSWGIMWPLINNQNGHWYPADTPPESLKGLQGYRVFIAVALILGDGLYNFLKVVRRTTSSFISALLKGLPISDDERAPKNLAISFDDERRTEVFVRDHIPPWIAYGCYVVIATLSIVTVPRIFPPLKWYHILVAHVFAPVSAFCNAYGFGLTDWSLVSTYGKLAIFVFGAWAGADHGGVLAGLAACGLMMIAVATASDLMQNFKTGYLTLASPRSMFASHVIGTAMGCVIAPCVFWLFYKAFDDIGIPGSQYPAPNALIYRNMAIVGVDGFSSLPKHCLSLFYSFFALAIAINLAKDVSPNRMARFIPIPMAMAIPFYIGASFAIDMCVGSVILYVWTKMNKGKASAFGPAVASGLICGEGMWGVPQGVLALAQALEHVGLLRTPFTRQENTVIQTAVVAAYGLAFSGGFGSYLFGMSSKIADQTTEANDSRNIKDPKLGWMIGFMFVVSFLGLFSLVPLRKIMIIDYKLIYPSGTATAYLINGFHTPRGADVGQVLRLQLPVGFFQWFYTAGDDCGFEAFPTFGLKAYANRFYFDFSATYVGVGMICPYIVNVSLLLGAILSWGLMSLINNQKGHWYSADIPSSSLHSLQGYRVFLAVALILGDGLYNILRVLHRTICSFVSAARSGPTSSLPISDGGRAVTSPAASFDVKRRNEVFVKDQIPKWVAYVGYVAMAIVSIVTIPHLFPPLKWYHILVAYVFAPLLAFCNAYGCGLTDWNLASTYGKLAIFVFGAWAGAHHGGVLAGLAACGVMMTIVATASDLMQDFKTGYLTLASPRSMFVSQVIGTAMGCVIAPCVFWLFYKAFDDIGKPGTQYPAPYALIYRNIAILGVDGFSSLPKHCLTLLHILRARHCHQLGKRYVPKEGSEVYTDPDGHGYTVLHRHILRHRHVLGKRDTVCVERINKAKADAFGPAVASGLICGDGIWSLPQECLRWLEATNMHEVSVEENE
ncbi:OPT oligopeptide transporter protein [Musa troglodytarum]|uniref:OPT oligopeptide transporter protein n=1 Tax=Musa troglodytarum TaxID=320322 RepID=A0A9E7JJG2_9LILI|nr:OPT oligopeptide transporter protein [Musa troglodytarum]